MTENLPELIDNESDCEKLFEMLADEPIVAMDSEFVWTKSYYPFVGVIQIGVSPEKSFVLDTVAMPECPESFKRFLENEKIMKVCHDAQQDIQIINYYAKTTAKNVLDTQLAAAFVGFGKSISLGGLIEMTFGKTLDKSEQRADWTKRPLTKAQIQYALDDVRYLTDSAKILIEIAKSKGVFEWILEDCRELSEIDKPFELLSCVERFYTKEVRMVAFKKRPKLYRLCYAVENKARTKNLPRSFLFKSGQLAEVVNCNPENPKNLEKTSLSPKMQKRYAQFFASTVNNSEIPVDEDLVNRILSFQKSNSSEIGTLTKEFGEILDKLAEEKEIAVSRIYNKKQLNDLVRDTVENKEIAPLYGWRNVFLGKIWSDFWTENHNSNIKGAVL